MGNRDVVVTLFLAAFGCGEHAASTSTRCMGLEGQLLTVIATHGSCETAADCQLVAGPAYSACDGEPFMIDCGGVPVERNAPGRERAEALTHEFFATHCDVGRTGAFDCAPQLLHCDADHHCSGTLRSCIGPPPDAGGIDG